jgi:hypothetical protein
MELKDIDLNNVQRAPIPPGRGPGACARRESGGRCLSFSELLQSSTLGRRISMSRRSSPLIHMEPDNTVQTYFELADLLPPLSSLGLVQSLARVLS